MDDDDGANGEVAYSIVGADPQSALQMFRIEPSTGYIETSTEIDREVYEK